MTLDEGECPQCVRGVAGKHRDFCTPERRFWRRVDKSGECWLWTSHIKNSGYGLWFPAHRVSTTAHRYSWRLHYGEVPDGLLVCHHCDNKLCVRPEHLFLGSPKDNMDDMWAKGRARCGLYVRKESPTCRAGHALVADNVHVRKNGRRECWTCRRELWAKQIARRVESRESMRAATTIHGDIVDDAGPPIHVGDVWQHSDRGVKKSAVVEGRIGDKLLLRHSNPRYPRGRLMPCKIGTFRKHYSKVV